MTEDEMNGWHHRLNGHEFEQVLMTVALQYNLKSGRLIPPAPPLPATASQGKSPVPP